MLKLRSLTLLLLLLGVYLSLAFIYPYSTFAMYDTTNLAVLTRIASSDNNNSSTQLPTSDNGYVLLKAKLQPYEGGILASAGWYKVNSSQFNTSNTKICPSNNCEYSSIEDGVLSPSEVPGEYGLDGKLKVNATKGDTKTSNIYSLHAELKKVGAQGSSSKPTEILNGGIGLVEMNIGSYFEYKVVNGTLDKNGQSPTLFLRAE